jgi:hypothetical protein
MLGVYAWMAGNPINYFRKGERVTPGALLLSVYTLLITGFFILIFLLCDMTFAFSIIIQ